MGKIKKVNEINNQKYVITREDEINVIAYKIPNRNLLILGRSSTGEWVVNTTDGIILYTTNEMEEEFNLDLIESDLERLTWSA